MKARSLTYFILFISIFVYVELKTEAIKIDTEIEGLGIYQESIENLEEKTDAYFYYDQLTTDIKNLVFTINTTVANKDTSIKCIFSKSSEIDDVINEFNSKTSICQVYADSTSKVYNVIVPLSGAESGSKLYLDVHAGKTCNVNLFLRGGGSFLNKVTNDIKLSHSFAYYAFEFDPKDYEKKKVLFTSSLAESFLVFGVNNNKNTLIDETSIILLNNQSLAAHFWPYEKVVVFVGVKTVDLQAANSITINSVETSDNLYYYIPAFNFGFSSFFYQCKDSTTTHYLISNFGNLDSAKSYNFKFHNQIPEKVSVADLAAGKTDVKSLTYADAKRYNVLKKTDSHLHVLKVQCPNAGKKINLNWKYSDMSLDNGKSMYGIVTKDFYLDFSKGDNAEIQYILDDSKELSLEVFTPDTETDTKFTVKFEGKNYQINNKNTFLFPVKDTSAKSVAISCESSIKAIVSMSLSIKRNKTQDDIYTLHNYIENDIAYTFYEIPHDFNANYNVTMTVSNPTKNTISVCYYVPTLGVIQNSGNNCFLMEAEKKLNLSLINLFEEKEDENNFNVEEPKYHLIVYNNKIPQEYKVTYVDFTTNLNKSLPINNVYKDHNFLYRDDNIQKDKKFYYNIDFRSKIKENHFDFYIKTDSDLSNAKELQFDLKCIMKYEFAAQIVDPFFTEDNNVCYLINNKDYSSNVFHYIFNNTKMADNEYLIIRVVPKIDMKIKFVIDEMNLIESSFSLEEGVKSYSEQSVYKIFQINMTDLKKYKKDMIFYNYDNSTEIYGRKGKKDFVLIKKGAFFLFKPIEVMVDYTDYDKILFIYGKNDCEDFCTSVSQYQIKHVENYTYKEIPEFPGSYRFPISINNCKKDNPYYYIFFDYGKQYLQKDIYLAKNIIYGDLTGNYIDKLGPGNFEQNYLLYQYFHKIEENKFHISIIRLTCKEKYFGIFDYFTQPSEDKEIQLERGVMRYYILRNNTNYTLDYRSISHIKVDVINDKIEPKITFESRDLPMKTGHTLTLIRQIENVNKFYLAGDSKVDIPVRITTLIDPSELPKTDINSLYKVDDTFVYVVEKNVVTVTFTIRATARLRLLLQEGGLKVCYNVAKMILLEKNEANCANINGEKLVYENQLPGTESYIVLFPPEGSPKFNIIKVSTSTKGGSSGGSDSKDGENKKKGLHWAVILLIIILVIAIIILVALIIIKIRKKTVTSEDIEKDIKEPTPISQE